MRSAILLFAAALAASGRLPAATESAEMALIAGRSMIVDYAADIGRISTSNPEVVDAVAVSTREVLLNAKQPGTATVVIWAKSGTRTAYAVSVEPNLEPVRDLLKQTFPGLCRSNRTRPVTHFLSPARFPTRPSPNVRQRWWRPSPKWSSTTCSCSTGVPDKQVLLRVRFAELNRNASSAFGVNLVSLGAANTLGTHRHGQFQSVQPDNESSARHEAKFTITDALNVFAFRPDLNLGAFIKALQNKNLLQILAEPNLVTTNGKEASFLVGGEFPVPVVQGGANAGAVTIVFKEFGIRLSFLPTSPSTAPSSMHVKPEVSTIDVANAVLYSGFTIPALSTRRMETNVELGEGQSFVIGGLIDARVTETMSKMPGLSEHSDSRGAVQEPPGTEIEQRADRHGDAGNHHAAEPRRPQAASAHAEGVPASGRRCRRAGRAGRAKQAGRDGQEEEVERRKRAWVLAGNRTDRPVDGAADRAGSRAGAPVCREPARSRRLPDPVRLARLSAPADPRNPPAPATARGGPAGRGHGPREGLRGDSLGAGAESVPARDRAARAQRSGRSRCASCARARPSFWPRPSTPACSARRWRVYGV